MTTKGASPCGLRLLGVPFRVCTAIRKRNPRVALLRTMPVISVARLSIARADEDRNSYTGRMPGLRSFFEIGCDVHERTGIDDDLRNEIFVT